MLIYNFINNEDCPARNGQWLEVFEPATGKVYVQAPDSEAEDVAAQVGHGARAGQECGNGRAAGSGTSGIATDRFGYFYDAHRGIPGNPFWQFDHFWGKSMAAGDFDGDGAEDLAVGAPDEYEFMGAVTILYGSLFADGFESQNFNAWSSHVP